MSKQSSKSRTLFQLAAVLAIFAAQAHSATLLPTLTTITIDGVFDDWSQVFTNPLQMSYDGNASVTGSGCYPTNPDRDCPNIGGTGRDVLEFAWTYDNTNIYTYLRRERSTAAVMHYSFIMDLDEDAVAETTDRVLDVTWNSGSNLISSVELFKYVPSNPAGDPMACGAPANCPAPGGVDLVDGYSMPGTTGTRVWVVTNVPGGAAGGAGDRFEVYIPWAQLKPNDVNPLPAGSPIFWHVASSTNGDFSPAIDNVGGPDGKLGTFGIYSVSVTPNNEGSAPSPGTRSYCHTITNSGQFRDSYNYFASSTSGLSLSLFTDNGSCGPGTLIAVDANGDGDFSDPGDTAPSAANDLNSDGLPDTGVVNASASVNRVVQLQIPSGFNNTSDTTTFTARSTSRPTRVLGSATDTTRIGAVTVAPEVWKSGVPGATVFYGPFTLQSNQGVSDIYDYRVTSSLGFSVSVYANSAGSPGTLLGTDSNGDGTWDSSTPNTGSVAAGGTHTFFVSATIGATAVVGSTDTLRVTVTSQTLAGATATSVNQLAVLNALTITPSYVAPSTSLVGNTGTTVFLPHRLINSQTVSDNATLSIGTGPAAGYTMRWFTDPDCDGSPSDGAVVTGAFTLAPFGGTACFVTEIRIPLSGAGTQSVQTTVATGSAASATASANDDVTVGNLQTFADSNYTLASRAFGPCDGIYARANNLTGSTTTTYQIRFIDSAGTTITTVNMPTNPAGVGTASYTLAAGDLGGNWTVQLRQGATVLNSLTNVLVERSGTASVTVPASGSNGQPLALTAQLQSLATRASYVDTSVLFEVKDPSLAAFLSDTVPNPEIAPATTRLAAAAFSSVTYPVYGNYTISATWKSSCGGTIATATTTMPVPPPAPTLSTPANNAAVATTTPNLTGSAETSATVSIYVDGALAGTVSGGSFTFTTAALSQGSHTWYATQTVNGVTSVASQTRTVIVDTTAPTSSITAPTAGAVFNSSPVTITGTASDATSGVQRVEVSINGGAWVTASGTTSWTYAFTPSADGSYSVRSRAVDSANNTSAASTAVAFTYDSTAPDTTILTGPSATTNSTSATFTFSATESGSSFQCSLDGAAFAACTSGQSYGSLADGAHTFQVRATDAAGNTDASPASRSWSVDTGLPTVTFTSTPPALANSATATFAFTASETATFECSLDGAAFSSCTSPRTISGLAQGAHTFAVRATDSALNQGPAATHSWTVDSVAPSSSITAPSDGAVFRTGPINVTVTATDATSTVTAVEVSVNGGAFQPASGGGPYTFSFTPTADGTYTLESRATDGAGNIETPTSLVTISWDTTAPNTTLTGTPPASSSSTGATFTFTSTESGSTFACSLDGAAFTACTSGIAYTGLSEASHTFQVRATDAVGNSDASPASFTWTVDLTSPTVSFTAAPAALSNSTSASFEFTASETATFECSLDMAAFAPCTSPQAATSLSQGAHSFRVRATDSAGNVGAAATHSWTVDSVPPTVNITNTPPLATSSTAATFEFTTEAGASLECSLDGAAFAACTSPQSYNTLGQGSHTFRVRATDAAGNAGTAASFTWTVDTAVPDTSFASTPPANDSSANATFDFASNEAAVTYECKLDTAPGFSACSDPSTFTMLANGTHTLEVRAVDAAGNTDATPASYTWNIDTTLPDTTIVAAPPAQTNQVTANFTFASTAAAATYECKLDGAATFSACAQTQSFPNLAEGSHTLEVRSLNAALTPDPSPATHAWTIDLSAPTPPVVNTIPANDNTPPITGIAEPGGTVTVVIDGSPACTTTADASGNFSCTPTTPLAEGPHTVTVTVTDPAGNPSGGTTVTVTTDTVAPTAAITVRPAALSNDGTPDFEFTANESPATFLCSVDGAAFASCVTPKSFTLTDGAHTFSVKARDAATNESSAVSHSWTIDTQAPTATITSGPAALATSKDAAFSFTNSEGATSSFECSLDGAAFASCASGQSYSGLAEGAHAFQVRATDAAGNTGAPATHNWSIDTVGPTATITSGPPAQTNLQTATIAFTSEANATFECSLDGAAFATCASPRSFSGLADGNHTFQVRAKDVAGNTGAAATRSWTIDRTAPVSSFTATVPAALTNSNDPQLGFTSNEAGSTFECSLDGAAFAPCTPTVTLTDVADGAHTFEVRATDLAGNLGAAVSHAWTIDTTAPNAPTLNPIPANDSTPTLTGTGEPGSTITVTIDGTAVGTTTVQPDGTWTFTPTTPVSDGSHTIGVTATDPAGNPSAPATRTVITDTATPTVDITSGPATLTNDNDAVFTFTSNEAAATFRCSVDGAAFAACTSGSTFADLADGAHIFEVRAVDAAGNQSAADTHLWTVDTVAPSVTFNSGPAANSPSATATFNFTANETSTFTCSLDGAAATACTSPNTQNNLADGAHALSVVATDNAGNASAPAVYNFRVDTTAPVVTITSGPAAITNATTAGFAFAANESATYECSVDGAAFAPCTSPQNLSGVSDGAHSFRVRAADLAGNLSAIQTRNWTVDTAAPSAPVVNPLSPSDNTPTITGTAEPGSTVTIRIDGAVVGTAQADGSGNWTFTPTVPLSDASHTVTAAATDPAGNTGPAGSQTVVTDTGAPTVSFTTTPPSLTNQTSASLSFVASEVVTFQCSVDGAAFTNCTSPLQLTSLADGSHTVQVRGTDAAGNVSATISHTWTVDATPPDTAITANPPALSMSADGTFTFSSGDVTATFQCSVDGAAFAACTTPRGLTGLADGNHTFQVRAVDPAGNADPTPASYAWAIDTTPPDTTLTSQPPTATSAATGTFTFTATEASSTFECAVDGVAFAACLTPFTTNALADGPHTFSVRARDTAGNPDPTPATYSWTVDSGLPETTIVSGPAALTNQSAATFTFTSNETSATFECSLDQNVFESCTTPFSLATVSDGAHTVQVRAKDEAGNVDTTPASWSWTVDAVAPDTEITAGPDNVVGTGDGEFTFTSTEQSGSYECSIDGEAFGPCSTPSAVTGLSDGQHSFRARAIDAAGNVDQTPAEWKWTVNPDALKYRDIAIAGGGCGCSSSAEGGSFAVLAFGLAALFVLRRRTRS